MDQVTILALACVYGTLSPTFRKPAYRAYRAGMFASLGLSALGFVTHGLLKYGWETQRLRMSLDWMIIMAACNFVGAFTYATRVSIPVLITYVTRIDDPDRFPNGGIPVPSTSSDLVTKHSMSLWYLLAWHT